MEYWPRKGTVSVHTQLGELYMPTDGLIDLGAERERLTKELEKIQAEVAKVEQKLGNQSFVQKVPVQVLAEHQQRLADWQAKLAHTRKTLDNLSAS